MTKNQEDYIKVLCEMKEKGLLPTNKEIAHWLKVRPSSVSEMLRRLEEKNYVTNKNGSISLTPMGEKIGKELMTKHRLWETFLIQYLGYDWTEVHEDAEILEHVTSRKLKNRLNEFLNYPKCCPHGNSIYENYDEDVNVTMLSEMEENTEGIIRVVEDKRDLLKYLDKKGLGINEIFHVLKKEDYDCTMTLLVKGNPLVLSKKATDKIFVEPKKKNERKQE